MSDKQQREQDRNHLLSLGFRPGKAADLYDGDWQRHWEAPPLLDHLYIVESNDCWGYMVNQSMGEGPTLAAAKKRSEERALEKKRR